MKKVIVKYLYRGQEKEKEITVADWHQLLASDKYQHTVGRLRANIALEGPHCVGTPEGLTDLPVSHFQRLPRGTYRHVCHQCSYDLYVRPSRMRRILREQEQRKTEIKK